MKEKAINAANDHNTDADRAFIQKEVNQRLEEINDIASSTHYNGRILLNGDYKRPFTNTVTKTWPVSAVGTGASATTNTLNGLISNFTIDSSRTTSGISGPSTGMKMKYHDVPGTVSYFGGTGKYQNTALKVDFSGATKSGGGTPVYPADFDGQGFSMGCTACNAYSSVIFDASIPAGESYVSLFYEDKPLTSSSKILYPNDISYEYVIGIRDVKDSASMAKAFYDGVYTANANEKSRYKSDDLTTNDSNGDAYFGIYHTSPQNYSNAHYLRISYENGEVFLQRQDAQYAWVFYNEGAVTQKTWEKTVTTSGEPAKSLIIHTGTKANENLHVYINDMHTKSLGIEPLEVNPREKAKRAIDMIDDAIDYALNEATYMGAYQTRLSETEATLVAGSENTTNAESVIRDADMAKTMMDFAKFNILQQSSQAMLAQANQNPQSMLSLLQ